MSRRSTWGSAMTRGPRLCCDKATSLTLLLYHGVMGCKLKMEWHFLVLQSNIPGQGLIQDTQNLRMGREIMASPQMPAGSATPEASQPLETHFRNSGGVGVLLSHAKEFDLAAGQIEQLEAMRPNFELVRHDMQTALQKAETQLRAVLQNETAAENEVMAAIDTVVGCQGELLKMRYGNLQKARAVLNDEQRSKVRAFRRQQEQDRAAQRRQ